MADFLAQRWRRQPQGPVVLDRGNSLVRKPLIVGAPWTGRFHNSLNGGGTRVGSTEFTYGSGVAGRTLVWSTTNQAHSITYDLAAPPSSFSLLFIAMMGPNLDSGRDPQLCGEDENGSARRLQFRRDNASTTLRMITFNPFGVGTTVSDAFTAGQFSNLVGVYHDGVEQRLYANKRYGRTGVGAQGALGSQFAVGSRWVSSPVDSWDGPMALWALFDTVWTDGEARALAENPWQIFRPRRAILYSLPAAGASFNPAWARNSNAIIQGVSR